MKKFFLYAAVLLTAVVFATTWVVVDVRPQGEGGFPIIAAAPLAAASLALRFVDTQHETIDFPLEPGHRDMLLAALREIAGAPDTELVRVEEPGQLVSIWKCGPLLTADVEGPGETVRVRLPLAAVEGVLAGIEGGVIEPADLVSALRRSPKGARVEVDSGDARVRVWTW